MLYVVKRDGRKVEFNTDKIRNAIKKASNEVGESLKESEVLICIQRVIKYIEESQKEKVSVEEVQNLSQMEIDANNIKGTYNLIKPLEGTISTKFSRKSIS